MAGIEDFAETIQQQMDDYYNEIQDNIDKATDIVAKEAVSELKLNSPERSGEYAKGWKRKKYKHHQVIYNAKRGEITAPLEHGHAKRGGGRVEAKPHIKPIEEIAKEQFEDLVVAIVAEGVRL